MTILTLVLASWTPQAVPSNASLFRLEIPESRFAMEGDTAENLPGGDLRTFRIVIRRPVGFGSIVSKINTESANIIMQTSSVEDTVVCQFDLGMHSGFGFRPGRNSVEISARDQRNRLYYASFVLTAGGPGQAAPVRVASRPESVTGIQKYAVIVGVSKYKTPAISSLAFADRDAQSVRDFLLSPLGGAFPRENIRYLVNEDATLTNVRTALFTFLTKPRKDDLVVIYFAGHGFHDPNDRRNLYLLPYDGEMLNMGGTALPMWEMQDVFTRIIKSRRIVTLTDACHSAGISGQQAFASGNNLVNQYLARYAGEGERAVLTASDINESSLEGTQWGGGHGVFTFYVLEGMSGKADRNKDGTVTAGELFDYVRIEVVRATYDRQTPTALPGLAKDLPMAGAGLRAFVPLQFGPAAP